MRRGLGWLGWLVLVVCAGLALTGVARAGEKPAPQTHTVIIRGFRYAPAEVTAKVGDTIVWTNKDIVSHTVTAVDDSFDSGEIKPGKSWKLVTKKAGTHAYHCRPHPNMHGTLVVQ